MDDFCEWEYGGPVSPPPPTEREGLAIGDSVTVGSRWPAVVIGFTSVSCDVVVEWTGRRPTTEDRSTVCRGHAIVQKTSP